MQHFMLDWGVIQQMIEGEGQGKDLLDKFTDLHQKSIPFQAVTTQSCFFRAIFLSNPDLKINNIQKMMNFLTIGPSISDYKNKDAVNKELLTIMSQMVGHDVRKDIRDKIFGDKT